MVSEDSRVVRSQISVMVPVDLVKVKHPTLVVRFQTLTEKFQTSVIWELPQHLKCSDICQ